MDGRTDRVEAKIEAVLRRLNRRFREECGVDIPERLLSRIKAIYGDEMASEDKAFSTDAECGAWERLQDAADAVKEVLGKVAKRPADRYKRYATVARRQSYLATFVVTRRRSFPPPRANAKYNWNALADEWNQQHPHAPMTPAAMKCNYYNAIREPDVQLAVSGALIGQALEPVREAVGSIGRSWEPFQKEIASMGRAMGEAMQRLRERHPEIEGILDRLRELPEVEARAFEGRWGNRELSSLSSAEWRAMLAELGIKKEVEQ